MASVSLATSYYVEWQEKTNIEIIFADILPFNVVQFFYLERSNILALNIDRLAEEGIVHTDLYSSAGLFSH